MTPREEATLARNFQVSHWHGIPSIFHPNLLENLIRFSFTLPVQEGNINTFLLQVNSWVLH
jgi:hypothetical protein